MKTLLDFLTGHWLALVFLGAALVALIGALWERRWLGRRFAAALLACAGLALPGVGALALTSLQTAAPIYLGWGFWILAAGATILFVLVLLVLLTGVWSKWSALAAGAAALLGFGGWALDPVGAALEDGFTTLTTVEFDYPLWLFLLLLAPLTVVIAWRSLSRFESARPWIATILRTLGILLLAVSLAEPKVRQAGEHITVLFVVDRSLSVPTQYAEIAGKDNTKEQVDLRQKRILRFLNDAVSKRNDLGHPRDRAGLIVFGKQPRLELPPSDAPRFNLPSLPPARDGNYTDIGAALKMALASFPEDAAKRIVLISDGNENLGNAAKEAQLARSMGVQIDVVPLAKGERNEEEVMIEDVDAPPLTEQGARVPITVQIRSYNPRRVGGTLTLLQSSEGQSVEIGRREVELLYGSNPFSFDRPLSNEQRSYSYVAEFEPEWYDDARGQRRDGKPPGDRPENNRAAAHVVARGRRQVLILEGKEGEQKRLEEALVKAGESKFKVARQPISVLNNYKTNGELATFLSNFDTVILGDAPEEKVTDDQQQMLRSNTEDQGCGLIMICGPDSFGAGGWQDTPVEKALPVDCDVKSLKVQGKGGLVLIMHGCEMMDGNVWEKKIAKLAVQRLGPADEIGVIDGMERWHISLQEIGDERNKLLAQLDKLQPGDMPTFDNCLKMAAQALNKDDDDPDKRLATKHVIIISDGDPTCTLALLGPMAAKGITVTTVGVATHGGIENNHMQDIADAAPPKGEKKGHYYNVTDPSKLPAIYIQEARLVSQSFIEEKRFQPFLALRRDATAKLPDPQQLNGYVRTTVKPSALVEVPIRTPNWAGQEFPLLAYWHYGLGKAVAFTSDAGEPRHWAKEWEGAGGIYDQFWQQVVDWSLRPTESARLRMIAKYRDGKIHITVDAQTEQGEPDTQLTVRGGITPPNPGADGGEKQPLRFVQTNSGRYEAAVDADESGSYFVNAQAVHKDGSQDGIRSGVTLPYSPEFSEPETNAALLEKLRDLTGGQSYDDTDEALAKSAADGVVFRPAGQVNRSMQPIWQWLLITAAVLLFLDIAVRRVSIDVQKVREQTWRTWARLRGIPLPPDQPEVLQGRRAQPTAPMDRGRAGRRFEATGRHGPAPAGADATGPPLTPGARPAASPDSPAAEAPEPAPADALEALRRARRRARGEDPDKPSQ